MHWRSVAVQVGSEPEFYQGTEFLLRADERVRVHQLAGFVWIAVHCKNRDKQLTFIVRVICSCCLLLSSVSQIELNPNGTGLFY